MWLRFCNLFYKQILQNRSQTSIFSLAPIFANFSLIKICKNWSHLKDWIFGAFSCLWFNDDKDNWRLHERSRMPWRSTAQHVRTSDSSDAHFTQPIDSLQLEQIRRAQAVAAMSQTNAALVSEMCSDGQNWPQNSKTSKSNLSSGSDFVVSFYKQILQNRSHLEEG